MLFYLIGILAFLIISIVLRLASAFGLSVPLLYGLIAPTLFYDWFHSNQQLAEGIGYALLGVVALCWLISLIGKIAALIRKRREDNAASELFLYRLRKAKAQGVDTVSTEGLWRA